jgi:hypothetical protein
MPEEAESIFRKPPVTTFLDSWIASVITAGVISQRLPSYTWLFLFSFFLEYLLDESGKRYALSTDVRERRNNVAIPTLDTFNGGYLLLNSLTCLLRRLHARFTYSIVHIRTTTIAWRESRRLPYPPFLPRACCLGRKWHRT